MVEYRYSRCVCVEGRGGGGRGCVVVSKWKTCDRSSEALVVDYCMVT